MNKDQSQMVESMRRKLQFLICDTSGRVAEVASPDGKKVSSPIQCFNLAATSKPDLIVIHFGDTSIQERAALVELAGTLKQNRYTRKTPILALLTLKHRRLIEDLACAEIDYLKQLGAAKVDSKHIRDILQNLGSGDRPVRHLQVLCPFIHYRKIDSRHEMTVCGAYRDRMVLGGRRLREICQTENHHHCEYNLNPRTKS